MVNRGMGWTVVDFLTASNLAATVVTAVPLHDFAPIPLSVYCAKSAPAGHAAKRTLDMLPDLLHNMMAASR